MTGERRNREPFRIVEHEGRQQPFTVWRGTEVWWFTNDLAVAEASIAATQLAAILGVAFIRHKQ